MADRLLVDVSADGRVAVSAWLDGGLPEGAAGNWVELVNPLDASALDDLRWYLEDYLIAPFGVYGDRGGEVATRLRVWGEALFGAVFGMGSAARDIYTGLRGRGAPLEVIVRSSSSAVLAWPWELLWDPSSPNPLALDLAGMSRALQGAGLPTPTRVSGDVLRVLMVIARPAGAQDIGYRMVARPLLERLNAVRGRVELVVLRPPTLTALQRVLQEARATGRPFQVVHFDGHGVLAGRRAGSVAPHMFAEGGEGFLEFEPADGSSGRVSAAQFALALHDAEVPLVVLNACQSGAMSEQVDAAIATRLMQEGIGAVVAMGYSVYAVAAAEFMAAFYERLFAGESVTGAVAIGRRRLFQRPERPSPKGELPLSDWMVPVHYLRREILFPYLARPPAPTGGVLSLEEHLDRLRHAQSGGEGALAPVGQFVGRDPAFYELERLTRTRRVVVVHGAGGSGKTELAKAFGRWWRDTGGVEHPDWVIVQSFEPGIAGFSLDGALATIGLRLFGPDFARVNLEQRRRVVIDALRGHRVLVIWDNFETVHTMPDLTGATPPLAEPERDELRRFLAEVAAPGGSSAVIVTSRTPESWLDDVGRLALGGLKGDDRARYTDQLLGDDPAIRARRAERTFGALLEWLDGHPLSMRLVLPHLENTDPAALLDGLKGVRELPVELDDRDGRTSSLSACISYSFAHLRQQTQSRLVILALLHGVANSPALAFISELDDIPERFKGIGHSEWIDTLAEASRVGLLTPIRRGIYRVHPALPVFLANLWREQTPTGYDNERLKTNRALVAAYADFGLSLRQELNGSGTRVALELIDLQRQTFGAFLGYALDTGEWSAASSIIQPLNTYWDTRGLTVEAQAWTDRVRSAVESPSGMPPALNTAQGSLWLDVAFSEANRRLENGELATAELAYRELRDMVLEDPPSPTQHRRLAVLNSRLARAAKDRGRLADAEREYVNTMEAWSALDDRQGVAGALHQLGIVAYEQYVVATQQRRPDEARKRIEAARNRFLQAIEAWKDVGDESEMAASYHELGIVAQEKYRHRRALSDLKEATLSFKRAEEIFKSHGDVPSLAASYHELGNLAYGQGDMDAAEYWYIQSLTLKEKLKDRPRLAGTYGQLSLVAEARGRAEEALEWLVHCVSIFDEFPSPLTGPAPAHIAALTEQLGWEALERSWAKVTGRPLPNDVREYVRVELDQTKDP